MSVIGDIAERTISRPKNRRVLKKLNGTTPDIVNEIISTDKVIAADTAVFAKHLQGKSVPETCRNIWRFIKHHIQYRIDPDGVQYIKTPAQTWKDKFADCKSYSLFAASILQNVGVPYKYRFVSFSETGILTHVYVAVPFKGSDLIIDCVMPEYNSEKPFKSKKDMTRIYNMSGIDGSRRSEKKVKKIFNLGDKDISEMTDAEMSLRIAKDRMLTEKAHVDRIRGVGSLKSEKYQDSIDMLNDAIEAVVTIKDPEDVDIELEMIAEHAVNGVYSNARRIHGISGIGAKKDARKAKKQERKADKKARKSEKKAIRKSTSGKDQKTAMKEWRKTEGTKTGKFLQKVSKAAKSGAKAVLKVATAPQRLLAKGILETTLPAAAPYFLYLFITDPAIIAKLPEKVRKKRKSQESIAKFIVDGIGMKEAHMMGILRNGIMKKYGKSPEKVIEAQMKGISGIGAVPLAIIPVVIELVKKIANAFGKKQPDVEGESGADPADWDGDTSLASEITNQSDDFSSNFDAEDAAASADEETGADGDPAGQRKIWSSI